MRYSRDRRVGRRVITRRQWCVVLILAVIIIFAIEYYERNPFPF